MYSTSAGYYDAIYEAQGKDYPAESDRVHAVIQDRLRSGGRRLLDVACGTGRHVEHLKRHYDVEGVDLSPEMLEIARRRNPDVRFHVGDMTALDLGTTFDAVICLFSTIGYVRTVERLNQTLRAFARHTAPGGVVVVGAWFSPEQWIPDYLHAVLVDRPDLKIARLSRSSRDGMLSIMEMHHLVVTAAGASSFVERHEMGLFSPEAYVAAFEAAGLSVTYEPDAGLPGRGLYVGMRPS